MENKITCNVCGGTSFHKDAGFYYCNECLTQSHEVREQVFDVQEDLDENQPSLKRKVIKQRRSSKTIDRLTTWECYNYILRGLVEELIGLGADVNLRKTIHILWLMYLKKLEVMTGDRPKVGAVHSKLDTELLYGKGSKRKRGSSTRRSSPVDSFTELSSQRTHSKDRHSYVLAQYNEISSTLLSDHLSQSLASLKSPSAASSDSGSCVQYSVLAKKELLKKMSRGHLKRHIKDTNNEQTCHNGTYKNFTRSYVEGPAVLSRIKMYGLLNLALLINKDNIQLGDLIRFIREGHLSFHSINHFYPEGYENTQFNLKTWNDGRSYPSHSWMRSITAKLAHFLNISADIPKQNLPELCRRFCHELNLPDEIWGYCVNLLSHTPPIMTFTKKSQIIPNYEGRVMSIIIFFLKLMFGLDNETEHLFSKRAQEINQRGCELELEKPMFVWDDWIFHILYRKLLLARYHFPTQYLYDDENIENSGVFLNFVNAQHLKFEEETKLNRESEVIQQLLAKLKEKYYEVPTSLTFSPSLAPFRSYTEVLADSDMIEKQSCLVDILKFNFANTSVKFSLDPFRYLLKLYPQSKVGLKHRGVQNNIQLISYKNLKTERELWRKKVKKECFVQLTNARTTASLCGNSSNFKLDDVVVVKNSRSILKNFEQRHKKSYLKHMARTLNNSKRENMGDSKPSSQSGSPLPLTTALHYNPYERYLLHNYNVGSMSYTECKNLIKTFPMSLQTLIGECARITEQDERDLLEEFNLTEVYLSCSANWTRADRNREQIVNKNLQNFIAEAKKSW